MLLAALLFSGPAEGFGWTVSVDPLTTALGFAHVQVEHSFGPRVSIYAGPNLRLYDGVLATVNGPYLGLGSEVGLRGFVTGTAPEGAWVMVRGVLARVSTESPRHAARLGGYTSGLVGYTGILGPGFVLSGGLGVSWFDYGVGDWGVHGVLPAAHTNIGWAL